MNKWIGMGRLTRDPEISTYGSGGTVARFSIAVDRRYKKEGQPEADFPRCVAFGKMAESIEKWLKKGTKIVVEGELQDNRYDDKNGTTHYGYQIIVASWEFAESKKASKDGGGGSAPQTQAPQTDDQGWMQVTDDEEDALPFD